MAQVVERQARDLEVRGSNPGPGSNFSLEFKLQFLKAQTIVLYLLVSLILKYDYK